MGLSLPEERGSSLSLSAFRPGLQAFFLPPDSNGNAGSCRVLKPTGFQTGMSNATSPDSQTSRLRLEPHRQPSSLPIPPVGLGARQPSSPCEPTPYNKSLSRCTYVCILSVPFLQRTLANMDRSGKLVSAMSYEMGIIPPIL